MRRASPAGLAALAATALVLVATTVPHDPCEPQPGFLDGPVTLEIDTTCGAAGSVVATPDPGTCVLTLEGADAVGLKPEGSVSDDGATIELTLADTGGECQAVRERPGVYAMRCYGDLPQRGCEGGHVPVCDGVLRLVAVP